MLKISRHTILFENKFGLKLKLPLIKVRTISKVLLNQSKMTDILTQPSMKKLPTSRETTNGFLEMTSDERVEKFYTNDVLLL